MPDDAAAKLDSADRSAISDRFANSKRRQDCEPAMGGRAHRAVGGNDEL